MRDTWRKLNRLTTPTALAMPLVATALLFGGCSSSDGSPVDAPAAEASDTDAAAEAARQEEARRQAEAEAMAEAEAQASCHPSYDPCLDPNAYDYDCEGGSGDGTGCEPY
jgi:hypothetical protein